MQPDEVARVRGLFSEFVRQLRAIPNDAPGVVSGPHHTYCDVNCMGEFQFGPVASIAPLSLVSAFTYSPAVPRRYHEGC